MTATVLDVDDICTHDELVNVALSAQALLQLLPQSANGDSTNVRRQAYERAVASLRRRMPPIRESDLSDPTELREAVAYASMMILHFAAITSATEGDVNWTKWKHYKKTFEDEILGFVPTMTGGSDGSPMSGTMERR
jgi:hypothetical protein